MTEFERALWILAFPEFVAAVRVWDKDPSPSNANRLIKLTPEGFSTFDAMDLVNDYDTFRSRTANDDKSKAKRVARKTKKATP